VTEVPSDSVAPGLSIRYGGNFESFRVEEQVDLCAFTSAQRTTLEDFLAEALAGLKLGVFVKLASFKLDVLVKALAGLVPEAELCFELLELLLLIFLLSEPV
jgi:hypothetical protein